MSFLYWSLFLGIIHLMHDAKYNQSGTSNLNEALFILNLIAFTGFYYILGFTLWMFWCIMHLYLQH